MNGRSLAGLVALAACMLTFLFAGPSEVGAQNECALSESERELWERALQFDPWAQLTDLGYPPRPYPTRRYYEEARKRVRRLKKDALGLEHSDRLAIQRALTVLGEDVGPVDGLFGKRTRRAIRAWQQGKGAEPTGYLTSEQAQALKALAARVSVVLESREEPRRVPESAEVP